MNSKVTDNIDTLFNKYQESKKMTSSKERVSEVFPFCTIHPQNNLKYYCQDDKSLLCIDCLRYHKDHNINDINSHR